MKLIILSLVAVFLTAACATVGREISSEQIASLKKGTTTRAETIAMLGQPTQTIRTSNGNQTIIYTFAHAQARPESFIPLIGAFVGGADVRSSALALTFDEHDVLQSYTQHQSQTASATGFSAGQYREPDRTLPQEVK